MNRNPMFKSNRRSHQGNNPGRHGMALRGTMLVLGALLYAATGNDAIRQKGDALVTELAKCQQSLNADGYLSAYPASFYDRLREGKRVWAPFYTYHKILAGHLDMYALCVNEQALSTAERMAAWRPVRGNAVLSCPPVPNVVSRHERSSWQPSHCSPSRPAWRSRWHPAQVSATRAE